MCQRAANDFSAHGSAWQRSPQNTEQKVSPLGDIRPLIGLSPATALTNTKYRSDTNGKQKESLILETKENEKKPLFGGTSMGFLPRYIRSQQRRMADIQNGSCAHC